MGLISEVAHSMAIDELEKVLEIIDLFNKDDLRNLIRARINYLSQELNCPLEEIETDSDTIPSHKLKTVDGSSL